VSGCAERLIEELGRSLREIPSSSMRWPLLLSPLELSRHFRRESSGYPDATGVEAVKALKVKAEDSCGSNGLRAG
jgi:hypothetical protein